MAPGRLVLLYEDGMIPVKLDGLHCVTRGPSWYQEDFALYAARKTSRGIKVLFKERSEPLIMLTRPRYVIKLSWMA
jgi:hypothetical protein